MSSAPRFPPDACLDCRAPYRLDLEHLSAALHLLGRPVTDALVRAVLAGTVPLSVPLLWRCTAAGHTWTRPPSAAPEVLYVPVCDVCERPVEQPRTRRRFHPGRCAAVAYRAGSKHYGPIRYTAVARGAWALAS